MPVAVVENADWIVLSVFLAVFRYDPWAVGAARIHVDGDGHPENVGTHEQLRFPSPSMRLSHLSHITLKAAFKEPFGVSSSLDELISYFGSELVGQFLLGAVAGRMLSSPQAGAVGDGPEQASTVPCDSDGAQGAELPIRHPPVQGAGGDRRLLLPLPLPGVEAGGRSEHGRRSCKMGWDGMECKTKRGRAGQGRGERRT